MLAQTREARPITWAIVTGSAVRAAFGIVWAIDAFLKWQPVFADHFVDAGPTLSSAFHVIGGMFVGVYPDGDQTHALTSVSTYEVAPGQGVVFDVIFHSPGKYPFVDHDMRNMNIGAVGIVDVSP